MEMTSKHVADYPSCKESPSRALSGEAVVSQAVFAKIQLNLSALSLPSAFTSAVELCPEATKSGIGRPLRKEPKRCISANKAHKRSTTPRRTDRQQLLEQGRPSPPKTAPGNPWQESGRGLRGEDNALEDAKRPRLLSAPASIHGKVKAGRCEERHHLSGAYTFRLDRFLRRWDGATRVQRGRMLKAMAAALRAHDTEHHDNMRLWWIHNSDHCKGDETGGHIVSPPGPEDKDVEENLMKSSWQNDICHGKLLDSRELLTPGVGLIMLRLLSYVRVSFSLGYSTALSLRVISLLTIATGDSLVPQRLVSGEVVATVLSLVAQPKGASENERVEALRLLRTIALVGGRAIKEQLTSQRIDVLSPTIFALSRSMNTSVCVAGRDLLLELGLGNPVSGVEVKNALLCLLGTNQNPMAQILGCQAAHALLQAEGEEFGLCTRDNDQTSPMPLPWDSLGLPERAWLARIALFVPPALDLSFSDDSSIRDEAEGLVALLANFPMVCSLMAAGLGGVLTLCVNRDKINIARLAWYQQPSRARAEAMGHGELGVGAADPSTQSRERVGEMVPPLQAMKLLRRLASSQKHRASDAMASALVPLALLEAVAWSFNVPSDHRAKQPSAGTAHQGYSTFMTQRATGPTVGRCVPTGTQIDPTPAGPNNKDSKYDQASLALLLRTTATRAVVDILCKCTRPKKSLRLMQPSNSTGPCEEDGVRGTDCAQIGQCGGARGMEGRGGDGRGGENGVGEDQPPLGGARVRKEGPLVPRISLEGVLGIALGESPELLHLLTAGDVEGFLHLLDRDEGAQFRLQACLRQGREVMEAQKNPDVNFTAKGTMYLKGDGDDLRGLDKAVVHSPPPEGELEWVFGDCQPPTPLTGAVVGLEQGLCQESTVQDYFQACGGRADGDENSKPRVPILPVAQGCAAFQGLECHDAPLRSMPTWGRTNQHREGLLARRDPTVLRPRPPTGSRPRGKQRQRWRNAHCGRAVTGSRKPRAWGPEDWDKGAAPLMVTLLQPGNRKPVDRSDVLLRGPVYEAVFGALSCRRGNGGGQSTPNPGKADAAMSQLAGAQEKQVTRVANTYAGVVVNHHEPGATAAATAAASPGQESRMEAERILLAQPAASGGPEPPHRQDVGRANDPAAHLTGVRSAGGRGAGALGGGHWESRCMGRRGAKRMPQNKEESGQAPSGLQASVVTKKSIEFADRYASSVVWA